MPDDSRGLRIAILLLATFLAGAGGAALVLWSQAGHERAPAPLPPSVPAPGPTLAPVAQPAATPDTGSKSAPATTPATSKPALAEPLNANALAAASTEELVAKSVGAVVLVETAQSRGSAFFVGQDRLVTNRHVVGANTQVTIKTQAGETLPAQVTARVEDYDLAVLQIASSPQGAQAERVFLKLGSALEVRPGQEVIAIGNPWGLKNSVTRGIVSAVRHRGLAVVIQTDAAVNPGNSGGPLIDRNGSVVGINSFVHTGEGINFAIAADHAAALLEGRSPQLANVVLHQDDDLDQGSQRRPVSVADADQARELAERLYEARLKELARQVEDLDGMFNRFIANYFRGHINGSFEHSFYAAFERDAFQGVFLRSMDSQLEEYRKAALSVRAALDSSEEDARRADVLPGTRRALRARYRFDQRFWLQ
jgi:S1-C subfamily serine protease